MSAKLKTVFVFLMIAVLFTFISCQEKAPPPKPPKSDTLLVTKVENIWKVVNPGNTDTLRVHSNDKIYWKVDSTTDAYFQFPVEDKKVFKPVSGSGHMSDGYTILCRAGEEFFLKIKDKPQKGPIVYAVFCIADSVFAIQNSPPVVVVE